MTNKAVVALQEVLEMVEKDIIHVRPSDREMFLSALEKWNEALASATSEQERAQQNNIAQKPTAESVPSSGQINLMLLKACKDMLVCMGLAKWNDDPIAAFARQAIDAAQAQMHRAAVDHNNDCEDCETAPYPKL